MGRRAYPAAMTPATTVVILLLAFAVGIAISYVVIRNAVCAGILDADRKRELATAERELVGPQTAAAPQQKTPGGWMDRIVG